MRTNVSPRMALRRWPMCAALLGLMLVCSTMILSGLPARRSSSAPCQQFRAVVAAVQPDVQISVSRDLDGRDAFDRARVRQQLLRDGARRLLQLPRELKRRRHGDLAEGGLLGLLRLHRRVDSIERLRSASQSLGDSFFQNVKHEQPE